MKTSFTKEPSISDEDRFSTLPKECIIDIFAFLKHTDLDQISATSQTILVLSNYARSKAVPGKGLGQELTIITYRTKIPIEYRIIACFSDT
ncbi:hypothetical protein PENTCL1PPCAC_9136, partial [Pristionchus entomophagus]